jgi:hypothetical protein
MRLRRFWNSRRVVGLFALLAIGLAGGWTAPGEAPAELPVHPNDNRSPAGQLRGDTLKVEVGETADFIWMAEPGNYTLGLGTRVNPAWVQRIVVR